MKLATTAAVLILLIPTALCAGGFKCTLPTGVAEAHLLSEGTVAVIDHYRAGYEAEVAVLSARHAIGELESRVAEADRTLERNNQAYADRLSSIRTRYLSSLEVTLESVNVAISPSSSALGDVSFSYTALNKSDRIITDITYRPLIQGITLPTTSSLVLEFIHPKTLISGIGPGQTMSNRGCQHEKFSFFISELSQDEIKTLRSEEVHKFDIEIIGMHFADKKGYKGQVAVEDFEKAFSQQLKPLSSAIERAQSDLQGRKAAHAGALAAFDKEKEKAAKRYRQSLEDLKKSSVRYSVRPDDGGKYVFEGVADGSYYLYASNGKGGAVFDKVTVSGRKSQQDCTRMGKDPFVP